VTADYVTLEDGTGMVHTAPGHGSDDYYTGLKHGLEIACPVLEDGTFDDSAPEFIQGLNVWAANPKVIDYLAGEGTLVHAEKITHSYPHDWRSKGPVIFRATEQWFVGVDKPLAHGDGRTLRELALEVCDKPADELGGVKFVPEWGRNRLRGMLENRPDWCISRQRSWGLPIPVFYNAQDRPLLTPASVRAVAKTVAAQGSDCWFTLSAADLLGDYDPAEDDALENPQAFDVSTLTKGEDIFDVWFESGSSWAAVALHRDLVKELPVDMYLEGSDQHRGWFQLSLLPALGATATPPFKVLLTHGFIVDAEGKKMSKSLGNAVDVQEQLEKRGADILRVWVASQDYQDDDRCSEELIAQCEDTYRKIRNTLRFCMGSIGDYEPGKHAAEPTEHSVDLWMKMQTHRLIRDVREAYNRYEFHRASRLLYQFCAVDASAVYLSAVKDRLYCEHPDSPRRRATQGVIREMLIALVKLLAPIIPHTAEEAWGEIPHREDDWPESVHLAMLPEYDEEMVEVAEDVAPVNPDLGTFTTDQLTAGPAWVWERLLDIRGEALVKLEALRNAGVKNPMDAEVVFKTPVEKPGLHEFLHVYLGELEDLLGVGHARLEEGPADDGQLIGIEVRDTRGVYEKCQRSWKRRPDVGSDPDYPDLSARDAKVVRQLQGSA
jgi:isoleucyl-tRNA synthetase